MTATSVPSTAPPAPTPPSLRRWGVVVFVLFLLTSAIGGSLALEGSYLLVTLASHIGLALVTLAVAGYATSAIGRTYLPLPRSSAALAAVAALGATIAGTVYLLAGHSSAALYAMEGLGGLGLLGGLLMMVFGGASGRRRPAPAA